MFWLSLWSVKLEIHRVARHTVLNKWHAARLNCTHLSLPALPRCVKLSESGNSNIFISTGLAGLCPLSCCVGSGVDWNISHTTFMARLHWNSHRPFLCQEGYWTQMLHQIFFFCKRCCYWLFCTSKDCFPFFLYIQALQAGHEVFRFPPWVLIIASDAHSWHQWL